MKAAGLSPDRLFLVPGNHDVDREKIDSLYLKLYLCETHDEILERVFNEGFRANLMAKFSAFHKFSQEAAGIRRCDGKSFHYAQTLKLEKDGKKSSLNLLGLNSAILAGYDGDDDRKLALGSFQVDEALSKIDRSAHLTLAFFHHPFSCFHGCDRESRNWLVRNADMILTGHTHEPANAFYHDSAGKVVHIGAGASYEKRESENAFDIVEIDLEKRSGIVRFYEYVYEHRTWVKNNRVNPFEEDGAFKFQLEPLAASDKKKKGEESQDTVEALPKKGRWEKTVQSYLDKAASYHSTLPLAGFKTNISIPIRIEDIYVPLRAMVHLKPSDDACYANADDAEKKTCGPGREREHEDVNLVEAFSLAEEYGRRGLVILGDPGSGKTTLLKRLLLYCYHEGPQRLGLPPDAVPVFLPLRDLADVKAGLKTFLKKQLSMRNFKPPEEFADILVEEKRALFLLDGLDEVSDPSHRSEVSKWIDDAIQVYRDRHWFAVTSRFAGYTEKSRLNAHFLEMHVRPLSREDAEEFVNNWYRIVETGLARTSEKERAREEAGQRAENLIARLRQPEFRARKVFAMTRNPLLLANLCLVHRDKGELPKSRAELYGECIEVLLERWRRAGGMDTRLTAKTGLAVLQPASYWMHREEGRKRATADELAPVIQTVLEKQNLEHGSPGEFLEIVRDESGILTGWGDGSFGFMHLGFQEYLAAREIRNRAVVDPNFLEELAERFGQPWFQEVILLFLALRDPSMFVPFMKRVVRQKAFGEPEHSELLEMCLDDAAEPSAEPFLELLKQGPGKDPGKNRSLWKRQLAALRALEQLTPDLKNEDFFASVLKDLENHPFEEISRWAAGEKGPQEQDLEHYGPSGYELVRIPGGTFMMGSEESERDRDDDEGPVHEVTVESFHMGRYPVTNAEYERFLKANPEAGEPGYWGERKYNRPEQPVVGVSWTDAKKFADWAGLDLPSEAQWEYACRAGTKTRYYTGDEEEDLNRAGWYSANSGMRPHPVGEKEPNRFGLHDMHGNVLEWCEDDWHGNYAGAPEDGRAWTDEPRGSGRVVRGGAWYVSAGHCRSAIRFHRAPSYRHDYLGFRLVLLPGRSVS